MAKQMKLNFELNDEAPELRSAEAIVLPEMDVDKEEIKKTNAALILCDLFVLHSIANSTRVPYYLAATAKALIADHKAGKRETLNELLDELQAKKHDFDLNQKEMEDAAKEFGREI